MSWTARNKATTASCFLLLSCGHYPPIHQASAFGRCPLAEVRLYPHRTPTKIPKLTSNGFYYTKKNRVKWTLEFFPLNTGLTSDTSNLFSINVLAFHHKCCDLIDYVSRCLFHDKQWVANRWTAGAVLCFKITMQWSKRFILVEYKLKSILHCKTIRLFALVLEIKIQCPISNSFTISVIMSCHQTLQFLD